MYYALSDPPCGTPRKDACIEGNFLSRLSETVIEGSKDGYPELEERKSSFLMC